MLNSLHTKTKVVVISGIAITVLASSMLFYYLLSKNPLQNTSNVTKETGVFLGRAAGKLGVFCSIKLENGKTVTMSCSLDPYYRIGQEVVLYKSTHASGAVSYRIQNVLDLVLKKPNPSFKQDYLR